MNTAKNAYKKYLSLRPTASTDSNKRVKSINFNMLPALDDFNTFLYGDKADEKKDAMHVAVLAKMQRYRPSGVSFKIIYSIFRSFMNINVAIKILDHFRVESTPKIRTMCSDEE